MFSDSLQPCPNTTGWGRWSQVNTPITEWFPGRLVLNVLLSVAQWEREPTGEALRHKIDNGEQCGRVRFGYDLAPDGKTLVPNAAEQQTIGLMIDLRAADYTLWQIVAALTPRGIPTKEGGTTWPPTAVARVLQRQRKAA